LITPHHSHPHTYSSVPPPVSTTKRRCSVLRIPIIYYCRSGGGGGWFGAVCSSAGGCRELAGAIGIACDVYALTLPACLSPKAKTHCSVATVATYFNQTHARIWCASFPDRLRLGQPSFMCPPLLSSACTATKRPKICPYAALLRAASAACGVAITSFSECLPGRRASSASST
jgi:hypothetical protein